MTGSRLRRLSLGLLNWRSVLRPAVGGKAARRPEDETLAESRLASGSTHHLTQLERPAKSHVVAFGYPHLPPRDPTRLKSLDRSRGTRLSHSAGNTVGCDRELSELIRRKKLDSSRLRSRGPKVLQCQCPGCHAATTRSHVVDLL